MDAVLKSGRMDNIISWPIDKRQTTSKDVYQECKSYATHTMTNAATKTGVKTPYNDLNTMFSLRSLCIQTSQCGSVEIEVVLERSRCV